MNKKPAQCAGFLFCGHLAQREVFGKCVFGCTTVKCGEDLLSKTEISRVSV